MRLGPFRVHGHGDERRGAISRCDTGGGDRADAADRDLVLSRPTDRADLFEPLDVDPIRELHHLRPPIEETPPAAALPPLRIPNVRVPVFPRAGIDSVDHIRRRVTCFLQQSNIGAHLHELAPRLVPLGDIPTHNRRRHLDLLVLPGTPPQQSRPLLRALRPRTPRRATASRSRPGSRRSTMTQACDTAANEPPSSPTGSVPPTRGVQAASGHSHCVFQVIGHLGREQQHQMPSQRCRHTGESVDAVTHSATFLQP